jgi:hypothetical protein
MRANPEGTRQEMGNQNGLEAGGSGQQKNHDKISVGFLTSQ